ncbi:MAG: ABC transporter ATP-binding protein [Candidatus Coatesbacteria bacterium]|nr:ABC transporter ATP-binding protein [Candidatus Coatesbacteria bacterium]
MNNESAITVRNLSKKFGSFIAVDDISFDVMKGEIFGFLGANGAGKSTTIRMLIGVLSIDKGEVIVGGYDVGRKPDTVKGIIGYMSQKFSLYTDLTVEENLHFYGRTYGLEKEEISKRISQVLATIKLNGREKAKAEELSGGLKQRLALGCSIIHKPEIIFLDEPTSGVDPISRRNFWELINNLVEDGTTVLVTTHFLEEAEYCNRIMLMHSGKLIAQGTPKHLKQNSIRNTILDIESNKIVEAMELLQRQDWISDVSIFGRHIHISIDDEEKAKERIYKLCQSSNIEIINIRKIMPSLEDVFIHLVEEKNSHAS